MDHSRYFCWQGDKVRLQPLSPNDARRHLANMLDTPSRQLLQLGTELPSSLETQQVELEKYAGCRDVIGVIIMGVHTLDGKLVGGISYHSRSRKVGTFAIGLDIHRPFWRRGYATDAIRLLLRYAFFERDHQRCNSACVDCNEASIALHRKLGFIEEGQRRRSIYFGGQYHDDVLFGLLREEFAAIDEKL